MAAIVFRPQCASAVIVLHDIAKSLDNTIQQTGETGRFITVFDWLLIPNVLINHKLCLTNDAQMGK